MPTSKFTLRGANPNKETPIVLYFRYGNQLLKLSTGFKILPSHWSEKKEQVKNILTINNHRLLNTSLRNIKNTVENIYTKLIDEGRKGQINNSLLRSRFIEETAPKKDEIAEPEINSSVSDYLESFLIKAPTMIIRKQNGKTEPLSTSSIKQYKNTLNVFKEYEKMGNIKVQFVNLDFKFHTAFLAHLKGEKGLANTTIGSRIKTIKTIAKYAKMEGLEVNESVFSKDFFKPVEESLNTYLNEEEIQRIFNLDLTDKPRLDNVRDLFIIGLWTGLRISDFTRIRKENLINGFIEIDEVQKTGVPVIIPIHPQVEQVIQKHKGNLPRTISHQKFNDYLKELCRLVGIKEPIKGTKKIMTDKGVRKTTGIFPKYELISSHVCRRSFATNNYGKFSNIEIMAVTGHKTEAVFLNYIKVTPREHAENMRAKWLAKDIEHKINISLKKVI